MQERSAREPPAFLPGEPCREHLALPAGASDHTCAVLPSRDVPPASGAEFLQELGYDLWLPAHWLPVSHSIGTDSLGSPMSQGPDISLGTGGTLLHTRANLIREM